MEMPVSGQCNWVQPCTDTERNLSIPAINLRKFPHRPSSYRHVAGVVCCSRRSAATVPFSGSESFHWHRLHFHENLIIVHYRCHVVSLFMEESYQCVRLLHQLRAEGLLVSTA